MAAIKNVILKDWQLYMQHLWKNVSVNVRSLQKWQKFYTMTQNDYITFIFSLNFHYFRSQSNGKMLQLKWNAVMQKGPLGWMPNECFKSWNKTEFKKTFKTEWKRQNEITRQKKSSLIQEKWRKQRQNCNLSVISEHLCISLWCQKKTII